LRLILARSATGSGAGAELEYPAGTISRDAEKRHIFVSIRKCLLFLNEGVATISIRGAVAIRTAGSVIRSSRFVTRDL